MASSRVGLRMTALTPVSIGCFKSDSSRGSTKASVLPRPDCTGVGVTKLFWARFACKTADTGNSEKVFIQSFEGKNQRALQRTTRQGGRVADLLSNTHTV